MSSFQFYQPFTGVVKHLVVLNALMFVGSYIILGPEAWNHETHDFEHLGRYYLAVFLPGSAHFQPFQIVTHLFMHADFGHLFFNMLSLYLFGPMVEMTWGHRRFLFYYLFCGLGSYALFMGVQFWELHEAGMIPAQWNVPMLGASGAIFGIYVAFGYLFPNLVINLLIPPIGLKAKYFVLIMAGAEIFYGIRGMSTGVAHFAHIGGAAFGFILILYWYRFRLK